MPVTQTYQVQKAEGRELGVQGHPQQKSGFEVTIGRETLSQKRQLLSFSTSRSLRLFLYLVLHVMSGVYVCIVCASQNLWRLEETLYLLEQTFEGCARNQNEGICKSSKCA